ncbi:MAG: sodium-dependent transporter [Desulfarculaceae bacterium]|nr:sodium-dependent transporter [Desulfarculaceae bacterium]MCF8047474.1 sodium-dependent transporter [Desulfarculaceae bacterium]MCF8063975.1 sodium-dependent transporter [Desulfarculaceae bacterium]MCF8097014.1 sodium-dependent transporter [Desulfarculaceae bacterium]MCF8122066.1 sodium-dependent transporter [Desulfarculaceae bacterium]
MREQWNSRTGFVLAAVGSAVGLGNIWRFPYMAYENGGGAFLIPYFFAMLTAGVPFLIMEFALGHRYKSAAPLTFHAIKARWEFLGWWQVLVCLVISFYYVVILGWTVCYFFLSLHQGWGGDPSSYFFKDFLHLTASPLEPGGMRWPIVAANVLCWLAAWLVLWRGVRAGIERVNKFFMPVLFILVLALLARAVTLPGAADGLNWLFKPDFSNLWNYKVWTAAYGQIFFTLSIGFGIMIAYSSYLPDNADIANNGFITVFLNCGFSLLAGTMVFGVLGFMAAQQGVPIKEVVSQGVGLAFATIPAALNMMPAAGLFGGVFFLALLFAGFSSFVSIVEACVAPLMEKLGWTRGRAVGVLCGLGLVGSLAFSTGGGLLLLDIVDHFINNFGIVFGGLAEIIMIAWLGRLAEMRGYINRVSDFPLGRWWPFCLKVVTPLTLGVMAVSNLVGDLAQPYGGYPLAALIAFGWALMAAIGLGAWWLAAKRWAY